MYARSVHASKRSSWTARQIADEADRKAGSCDHVKNPQKPTVLFGMTPSEAVDFAESEVLKEVSTVKLKSGEIKNRGVRSDRPILLAGVASYQEGGEHYDEWRSLTLDFLKREYGDSLRSVIEHTDEAHPHLHFYAVADKPSQTQRLHRGANHVKELIAADADLKSSAGEGYKTTMRLFQDDYWHAVGFKIGMARTGPKRERLTHDEWLKAKVKNLMVAETIRNADAKIKETEEILKTALKEADAKNKEATAILKTAADVIDARVNQRVDDKLKILISEESRIDRLAKLIDGLADDHRIRDKIKAAKEAFQSAGTLENRLSPVPPLDDQRSPMRPR